MNRADCWLEREKAYRIAKIQTNERKNDNIINTTKSYTIQALLALYCVNFWPMFIFYIEESSTVLLHTSIKEAEETVNDLETTAETIIYVRKVEVEETADYQIYYRLVVC